jgi:hypothetical protein
MEKIEIKDFADGGILREQSFREKIEAHDWGQYDDKAVLIQGCADIIIPTWAYLVVTAKLVPHAARVYFGEQKTRIPIWKKL